MDSPVNICYTSVMKIKKNGALPNRLKRYFWDTNSANIKAKDNANYIISRLLEYGDFAAVKWIFDHYSKKTITKTVQESRQLSSRTKTFWSCYLRHQI